MRAFLVVLGLLALWEIIPQALGTPAFLFPRLSTVLARLGEDYPVFLQNIAVTFSAVLASFFVSIAIGSVTGAVVHSSRLARSVIEPIVVISQVVPRVALVPLILVWFGFGLQSKLMVAVLIAFFPIYEGVRSGLQKVDDSLEVQSKLLGYSKAWIFWNLKAPFAAPNIFVGLKTASLFAVVGVIVAEFLASGNGAGIRVVERMARGDTAGAFAYMLLISALGGALYLLILALEQSVLSRLRLARVSSSD
jgi:NitT/TauT family transport system permease protein